MSTKKRCSIAYCPWRATHYFTGGYQECWFHYEEMALINWAWELFIYPTRKFFYWMRYRVCGSLPRGAMTYWVERRFLLMPRLRHTEEIDFEIDDMDDMD